jgi:hypothetical protein
LSKQPTLPAFRSMAERLHREAQGRIALAERALAYNIAFLDDALRAILPHDLVLIGAPTGMGKTELALDIAARNAMNGRPTHYFALEAEDLELERRRKYALIADRVHRTKSHPNRDDLNYTDWFLGRCDHIVGDLDGWADEWMREHLSNLHTFYRGQKFDGADLGRAIIEIHRETSLIIIDHLHYVDADENADENRALHENMKIIRDVSLRVGKPVILVAHLRKKDERAKKLVPSLDDFHGSSNLTKIATQVITIERAHGIEASKWWLAPTFMSVSKDRRAGAPRQVAVTSFDVLRKVYAPGYTLGMVRGSKWEELELGDVPRWARGHRPITGGAPSTQEAMNHPNAPGAS